MNILFICTGNTCRSPMAEAIFNKLNILDNVACSAGLSICTNSIISLNAGLALKASMDIDITDRKAVQLTGRNIEEADLVLTMTNYMKEILIRDFPSSKNKVNSLNEYVGIQGDIMDPYGSNLIIYSETLQVIKNRILLLSDKIKKDICII